MFWKLTLASSPVDAILDKENFTLEELLDEEEIIQECKALNTRLINFLRDRAQVEQLLHYIIEEAPEDADSKRAFKFPFIACEIFTCEIDVILKTLVEEDELMNLLVSFLEPNRPHSALLAGYFSKVVICLMLRKTVPLMNYVQAHQDIFRQLVDLIGITSIMEVLIRLVGADDHVYPNYIDVMQWLADGNLLEMIVDKLSPSSPPEVHANAAETLCAITRNTPSALATKLSSPSFVSRIFGHALEDSHSKSGLVHSLSVCISLLDPKKSAMSFSLMHSFRSQYIYEPPVSVNPETISAMLPKLGDLLMLLNVSNDEKVLPTTYGELKPPLGKHRLKIVEFISVLLKTDNEAAEKELVNSGTIKRILDLFFEYPYNNALHHHVESIILSSLETKSDVMVDHLLQDCDLIGKMLQTDKHPVVTGENNKTTMPAAGKKPPRAGNLGHITRIGNKLVQLGTCNSRIQTYLQEHNEWTGWRTSVLQERNAIENVYRWSCGRPTALQDRARDSDDDDIHDRDYDVAALANNISQAFRYNIYENEEAEEGNGDLDRDNEDVYFDDESAEVVISSLRLGDEQGSLFTNSNWFAFQDERIDNTPVSTSAMELMEEINLNGTTIISDGNGSDDEVVVGEEDELTGNKESVNGTSTSSGDFLNGLNSALIPDNERASEPNDINFFKFDTTDSEDLFEDKSLPEWVGWSEPSNLQVGGSSLNPFEDNSDVNPSIQAEAAMPDVSPISGDDPMLPNGTGGPSLNPFEDNNSSGVDSSSPAEAANPDDNSVSGWDSLLPNGSSPSKDSSDGSGSSDISQKSATVPSLFEEDVEFIGVEIEGTEKAMEQALKEGIVGEAGPLKRNIVPKMPEKDNSDDGARLKEFNDTNYWRVEQDVAVLE